MENIYQALRSWKTSSFGGLAFLLMAVKYFGVEIETSTAITILTGLVALVGIFSKDATVSHTNK